MNLPRLGVLLVVTLILSVYCAPQELVLNWSPEAFHRSDNRFTFADNQRLSFNCENGSHGTIVQVSEECFSSCLPKDCNAKEGQLVELITCNGYMIGPVSLRSFSPIASRSYVLNKTYYFTSLNRAQEGRHNQSLCGKGLKFAMTLRKNITDTPEIIPFSNASTHFVLLDKSTLPLSKKHEYKITTTRSPERKSTTQSEGLIEMPMLSDKEPITIDDDMKDAEDEMRIEELARLERMEADPWTPMILHGRVIKFNDGFRFERIGSTMYGDEGGERQLYEIALPLGVDPNASPSLFFLPITLLLLLIIL